MLDQSIDLCKNRAHEPISKYLPVFQKDLKHLLAPPSLALKDNAEPQSAFRVHSVAGH